MDHWSNINSAYGRLSSASGISPNTSGLSPFDLHVMDQRGFGNSGLTSGLANPLPAHATPLQPARLTSMPHPVNYGALHGSMTPLFDAFGASGFPNQTPYRPVGQALYSLEAVSSRADTMSRLASVISSQPSRSSLFDADLHAMNDSPVQGLVSAESSDFWPRPGFMPATGGVASFVGMPSSSASCVTKKDPPPAHSGSRPTVPAKTRYCHEPPSVTQQSMKTEFAQRPSATRLSRSLAPSPPTAHVNSQHFEAQRFYDGRSSQPMTTANNQQYIEPGMHMDLNDVISSDDTSGSLVGHSSFGGCSPTSFSSSGFPMTQKTRPQAVFQPTGELSSSPSCLGESRLHGAAYGALSTNSSGMSASYADFGMRKDYAVGTSIRTGGGSGDAACGRNIDREDSFVLGGMLVSTAGQSSISNLLTVQAVADSTTKPKKPAARAGRTSKSGRTGRTAAGPGFDVGGYPDDNLLAEGLNMSDGKRGKGSKSRRSAESRDVGQNDMMLENIDRYVPQLVGSASGVNSSAMFVQAVAPEVHLPGSLLHSESYAYNSVMGPGKQANDAQLFFTNVCGNSFVSPNEFLIKANATENYTAGGETPNYNDNINYEDTAKPNEPAVVDEEFMHLTEAPVAVDTHKHPTGISSVKSDAKSPAAKANFLASFVNFLSGKKTETLSSVSNVTAAGSRPVMPKYIPDPLLKRKEETVAAAAASDSAEKPKTFLQSFSKEMKTSESKMTDSAALAFVESAGSTSRPQDNRKRPVYKKKEDLSEMKANQALGDKANFTPARPQPTRRAKTAVEEKRRNFLDGYDSSDEELKVMRSQSRSRRKNDDDDYDSDKDPAWKPECGAISNRKRPSYDRDDEYFAPSRRNRNKRYSAKSESTNEEASWASPPVAPVSQLSETRSIVTSPKSSPTGAQFMPSTEHLLYQKGSFVIEKKDLKNLPSLFSIWKIDSGRLLQKFEPLMRDGKVMHQAISTYSSWSDDIKENYSAVKVNIIVASRSQEIVEVVGGIKADVDGSVMLYEPLLEPFNIFVQILLSQSLEPNFLDALHQDPDPYYMNPLAKIEAAIESGVNKLKDASKWTKEFLDVADKLSGFSFLKLMTDSTYCQATEDAAVPAVTSVLFSGTVYDSLTLKSLEKVESCKEIAVGEWTQQHLPAYHGLRHLKFTFYQKCEAKVQELKNGSEMEDHQLLDLCLQNLTWMKELFTTLECLLKEANSM